jgi:hypothetical protein
MANIIGDLEGHRQAWMGAVLIYDDDLCHCTIINRYLFIGTARSGRLQKIFAIAKRDSA